MEEEQKGHRGAFIPNLEEPEQVSVALRGWLSEDETKQAIINGFHKADTGVPIANAFLLLGGEANFNAVFAAHGIESYTLLLDLVIGDTDDGI